MKNYIIPFVCSVLIFAGMACSHKYAQQITPDRVFFDVSEGTVKRVSYIGGVQEDKTSYFIPEGGVKFENVCIIRFGTMFSADGIICEDTTQDSDADLVFFQDPVRDSLGRVVEFGGEKYSYLAQELRPTLNIRTSSIEHYIYKGKSFSPYELYYVNWMNGEDGKITDMEVWRRQYKYIEKDSHGNWIKREAFVTTALLSGETMDYYIPLCDHELSMDTREQLEKELSLELENKSNKNIEIGGFTETESRDIEYYE